MNRRRTGETPSWTENAVRVDQDPYTEHDDRTAQQLHAHAQITYPQNHVGARPTGNSARRISQFLPREAMLSAVYAVVVCLCVCLCVCHTPVLYQNG